MLFLNILKTAFLIKHLLWLGVLPMNHRQIKVSTFFQTGSDNIVVAFLK